MIRRTDRVAELLRAELSDLLLHRVKDPRVKLVSISTVEVNADLSRAVIGVSALGEEDQRQQAVDALIHASGYLRTQLSKRLRLRTTPELVFRLDRGAEHSQRISEILENLHAGDEPT
ncbi:MAG: 30S ribosome-binding factor RbfA [Acidobacteriota bacterium]|nr:30S ribosome-binding factor RbfA [Acidobacteriota bacterium]